MHECPKCGRTAKPGEKTCAQCGTSLLATLTEEERHRVTVEDEILQRVIERVETYWREREDAQGDNRRRMGPTGAAPMTNDAPPSDFSAGVRGGKAPFAAVMAFLGWISLAGGVIGAVVFWTAIPGDPRAAMPPVVADLAGGLFLFGGVLLWVLLRVVSRTAGRVEAIARRMGE